MRVLVTGGCGFIGSHVVDRLVAAGHDVRVLEALLSAVHRPDARPPGVPEDVELVVGDVRDAAAVGHALDGVDVVCHQAAMVGLGVDLGDMPDYVGINDLGTAVLLAGMAAAGTGRLVLASSMVVYGEGRYRCSEHGPVPAAARRRSDLDARRFEPPCPHCGRQLGWEPVAEDAVPDPRSTYAVTKLTQERLAAVWAASTGGSVVALRYHNVYGPRMSRDTPYSGVAALFRSALEAGRAPKVFEDGGQQRDFVHVGDVAEANLCALTQGGDEGRLSAYNIASGRPRSVGDLARALTDAFGGPLPLVTGEYRVGDVRHVVASPERAAEALGFRARVAFEDGVRSFATAPLRGAAR